MINFEKELKQIFGSKYEGCTQADDELIEYRLKYNLLPTEQELQKVNALPISRRQEIDELKLKITVLENRLLLLENSSKYF